MTTSARALSRHSNDTSVRQRLLVAVQDPCTRAISPIGLLESRATGYSFAYLRRVLDVPGFRPLLGFEDLERRYESHKLFPLFQQRLMDPRRPDYHRYMAILGLNEGAPPLVVLGRSEGRRAGDAIFLVPEPEIDESGRTSCVFFVHGSRYKPDAEEHISALQVGSRLQLLDDPENPINPKALIVTHDGNELGWVPDLLVEYVHQVRDHGGHGLTVVQVNGHDVPPNLRLQVQLKGMVPAGFHPFEGEEWATTA